MAVTFDVVTSASGASVSSLSFSHTPTTQANRLLYGMVTFSNSATSVSSMTYNSVAMTVLDAKIGLNSSMGVDYLVAPATGSNTAVFTLSGSSSFVAGNAVSYYGVNQSTPVGTPVNGQAAVGAPSVTATSATGETVVDWVSQISTALTVGSGQTQRYNAVVGTLYRLSGSDEAGAASVVMDWTGINAEWTQIAVSTKPSVDTTVHRLLMMGCGI